MARKAPRDKVSQTEKRRLIKAAEEAFGTGDGAPSHLGVAYTTWDGYRKARELPPYIATLIERSLELRALKD